MLSPEDAWRRIDERLPTRSDGWDHRETVARADAVGRVLASAVQATVDVPMADVSAMDGYALAGELAAELDGRTAGASAEVVGTVPAGRPAEFELRSGQAAKIMTGAVVPAGADRVVPVEQTREAESEADGAGRRVIVERDVRVGAHIRLRGEVEAIGDELMAAGSLLTAGAISTLASHGIAEVEVVRAPTVAVLTTGDEVVPPETTPGPGQLRDSNGPFLQAAGRSLGPGLTFEPLGTAEDDRGDLEARVRKGLDHDVLLLTGGVSMGEFDYVGDILRRLGCEQLFHKTAIQPGKPLLVAVHERGGRTKWVFGLPGNPASVMVTYWLFVRPVLRRLLGHRDGLWQGALEAELSSELPGSKGRDRFLPAALDIRQGKVFATPRPPVGSHDAGAYGRGTGLVRIRPNRPPAPAGDPCEVLLVD